MNFGDANQAFGDGATAARIRIGYYDREWHDE
jgi:hypothetical protein